MITHNNPFRLADIIASACTGNTAAELQSILEEKDTEAQIHKCLVFLMKEQKVTKLKQEINAKVEEKIYGEIIDTETCCISVSFNNLLQCRIFL